MDTSVVDEVHNGLIALLVLSTQVLGQVDQQLSAHRLVAVHVGDVLKFWFTWKNKQRFVVLLPSSQLCNGCLVVTIITLRSFVTQTYFVTELMTKW